jgi:GTP-sensing pleiotropic transcriptional regulator CodY
MFSVTSGRSLSLATQHHMSNIVANIADDRGHCSASGIATHVGVRKRVVPIDTLRQNGSATFPRRLTD